MSFEVVFLFGCLKYYYYLYNMENKLKIGHTVLYLNGMYENNRYDLKTGLRKSLALDGYSTDLFNDKQLANCLLNRCKDLDIPAFNDIGMFANGISPEGSYKYGYFHQSTTPLILMSIDKDLNEYNIHEAIIYYCVSNIITLKKKYFEELPQPIENF